MPARLLPAAGSNLVSHLEQPATNRIDTSWVRVLGWAFLPGGRRLTEIRLERAGWSTTGFYGFARPDVAAAFPSEPAATESGFEIRAHLPSGRGSYVLRFREAETNQWHSTEPFEIETPRWRLPSWVPWSPASELLGAQLHLFPQYLPRPLTAAVPPTTTGLPFCIVTPSFNHARFVGATLHSVLQQTGVPIHFHVQDGGSSDETPILLARVKDARFSWVSTPDKGQADAIVHGFSALPATSDDIMGWINSDDVYLPGALARVGRYFEDHPEIDVVYANRILIDEQGNEVGRWYLAGHDAELFKIHDYLPQETLFWRRRAWDQIGGLDPRFRFAMDWDLALRFQEAGLRIAHVPEFWGAFRLHLAQKSTADLQGYGMDEIDAIRARTRPGATAESIDHDPRHLAFLRRCAWLRARQHQSTT